MGAHLATNLWLAESWSGYALDMRAQGSLLLTPAVVGPNRTNFTEGSGTIRLWYSPTAWASSSAGGNGPGEWATLFELAQTNTVEHPFRFALSIDPFGTNLVAAVSTQTGSVTLVQSAITWSTGQWHQIAFVYDGTAVELFVDDNSDTISFSLPTWSSNSVWNQSAFTLGSGFDGNSLSMGQLDEIHTFGYPLSTNYLTWTYQLYATTAALGPLPDEIGGEMQSLTSPSPCDPCPTNGGGGGLISSGDLATNGFRFAMTPYTTNGTGFVAKILDTYPTTNKYEIYRTFALAGTSLWNSTWSLVATGGVGVTNFTLSYSTNTANASFWAFRFTDSDGDLDSDSVETLLLGTSPTNYNDADTDGLSDRYEVLHGTSTNLFDSDTNGLGDQLMTVSWWVKEVPGAYSQDFIIGDGFRIVWFEGPAVFLNQFYQDVPVRDWMNNDALAFFPFVDLGSAGSTNVWRKWTVKYDYRTCRIYRQNSSGVDVLMNATTAWQDNVTERLGTNYSASFTTNDNGGATPLSNVVVTPFIHARKNPYVWEGVVGNTSDQHYGDSTHNPYWPIVKFALGGSNIYYTCGYNEGGYQLQMFSPTNPQAVLTNFSWKTQIGHGDSGLLFTNLAVQTNTIFAAGNTFQRYFRVANTTNDTVQTVFYDENGAHVTDHGLVQPNATNLFLNCMADSSGTLPGQLTKTQPYFIRVVDSTTLTLHTNALGALNNTARANITTLVSSTNWLNIRGLVYSFNVTNFTFLGSNNWYLPLQPNPTNLNPTIAAANRVDISTNPVDGKIAVFDGSSQQVKIYSSSGSLVLTIGTNGGYANGPAVPYPTTNDTNFAKIVKLGGYYDDDGQRIPRATVCYQTDGKLWVSDTATSRMLRFNADGSLDTFIETVPHSYRVSVDPNNTNRLFVNYLEFRVDHSQPFKTSWVLTNYWAHDFTKTNGAKTSFVANFPLGFQSVVTVTNSGGTNRTFAHRRQDYQLVELTDAGMKETLSDEFGAYEELEANGTVNLISTNGATRSFQRRTLLFANGIPYLSSPQQIAAINNFTSAPVGEVFKVAGTNFVVFDILPTHIEGTNVIPHTGPHLGAIATNGASSRLWTWTNSFGGVMDGRGSFETNAGYGGQFFTVIGDDIFFVYEGEGWRGRLANQIFHFKTDGRFVGQFGLPLAIGGNTTLPPGSAANLFTVAPVRVGNTIYLYTNDEASRGAHRWRINL